MVRSLPLPLTKEYWVSQYVNICLINFKWDAVRLTTLFSTPSSLSHRCYTKIYSMSLSVHLPNSHTTHPSIPSGHNHKHVSNHTHPSTPLRTHTHPECHTSHTIPPPPSGHAHTEHHTTNPSNPSGHTVTQHPSIPLRTRTQCHTTHTSIHSGHTQRHTTHPSIHPSLGTVSLHTPIHPSLTPSQCNSQSVLFSCSLPPA